MNAHLPILLFPLLLSSLVQAADKADLIRLYEEEVLAHDLYVELAKLHPDVMPLRNIPHSEKRHQQAMADLLKHEGLALAEVPSGRRFVSDGLDELYRTWLAEGRQSAAAACRVGVRLEEHDIADLRRAQADYPAYKQVLAALESASHNHLRAFHLNLTRRDGNYVPTALEPGDFEAIVTDSDRGSKGPGTGRGRGWRGVRR